MVTATFRVWFSWNKKQKATANAAQIGSFVVVIFFSRTEKFLAKRRAEDSATVSNSFSYMFSLSS